MRQQVQVLLILATLGMAFSRAYALNDCKVYLAQFSGRVKEIKTTSINQEPTPSCAIQIRFDSFRPSVVCPMFVEIAEKTWIPRSPCPEVGSEISGVLEQLGDQNSGSINIDE